MRILFGAVAALALVATAASAQTTTPAPAGPTVTLPDVGPANPPTACAALQPAPTLPDGATANNAAMTTANATYLAWATANRSALECRRAEVEATHTRWQALANEYNAAAQAFNGVNASWEAETNEYNERTGNGGRRRGQ
jgi:hypothetical protein